MKKIILLIVLLLAACSKKYKPSERIREIYPDAFIYSVGHESWEFFVFTARQKHYVVFGSCVFCDDFTISIQKLERIDNKEK